MEGSKITTTGIDHLSSWTKNKQKKKEKKIEPHDSKFVVKQYIKLL